MRMNLPQDSFVAPFYAAQYAMAGVAHFIASISTLPLTMARLIWKVLRTLQWQGAINLIAWNELYPFHDNGATNLVATTCTLSLTWRDSLYSGQSNHYRHERGEHGQRHNREQTRDEAVQEAIRVGSPEPVAAIKGIFRNTG